MNVVEEACSLTNRAHYAKGVEIGIHEPET